MFYQLMDVIYCERREYFAAVRGGARRYRHRSFTDLHLLHSAASPTFFFQILKELSRWPLVEEATTLAIDWLPYAKEMCPADAIGRKTIKINKSELN